MRSTWTSIVPARTPFMVYLPSCAVLAAALVPSASTRASLSGALVPCAVTRPVTVPCAHAAVPTRHIAPAMSTRENDRANRPGLILYSSLCEWISRAGMLDGVRTKRTCRVGATKSTVAMHSIST